MLTMTKLALAAAAALAATALAVVPASADPMWGNHGHWHHGPDVGFGFSFGGPYYGYDGYYAPGYAYDYGEPDYGPPAYAPPAYASNDAEAYCASRFRSYNPVTQSYTGYDGLQHPCP
jgi:hypothetical protein